MKEFSKEEKEKYVRRFKNCTLTLRDYAYKMKKNRVKRETLIKPF